MSLFLTAGYPDPAATAELVLGFEKNGVELVELGMPFSDPLADGPTIQYASDKAIENGITIDKIFGIIEEIREKSEIPVVLMGYLNPVLRYGVDKFCKKAKEAGADGLIIPDVPAEESGFIRKPAAEHDLSMIFLIAPNTTDERMQLADSLSDGFVYCVSVTGVTGAREAGEVSASVNHFIKRAQTNITRNPLMTGFGINSHESARKASENTHGFIVGSALIEQIRKYYPGENWQAEVLSFVHSLKFGN